MLATEHRLRTPAEFSHTVRRGRKAGVPQLVVYATGRPEHSESLGNAEPARAGFVVSKAVGNAVERNRVKRRLRHLVRERLAVLPSGTDLVIRALPNSAGCSSEELAVSLDRCLQRVVRVVR